MHRVIRPLLPLLKYLQAPTGRSGLAQQQPLQLLGIQVMRARAAIGLILALLSQPGCAMYQNVAIESQPEGAEIYLDGEVVGRTPARFAIDRVIDHSVFVKKEGYRPELVVLTLNPMDDGIHFLTPADVRVRLAPLRESVGGDVEVEMEE